MRINKIRFTWCVQHCARRRAVFRPRACVGTTTAWWVGTYSYRLNFKNKNNSRTESLHAERTVWSRSRINGTGNLLGGHGLLIHDPRTTIEIEGSGRGDKMVSLVRNIIVVIVIILSANIMRGDLLNAQNGVLKSTYYFIYDTIFIRLFHVRTILTSLVCNVSSPCNSLHIWRTFILRILNKGFNNNATYFIRLASRYLCTGWPEFHFTAILSHKNNRITKKIM